MTKRVCPMIYMIRNTVSGKMYIGQTAQSLARRKGEHIHRSNRQERDHRLYMAMRKYGVEAFEFTQIACPIRPEYLDELECILIEQYGTYRRGYNMNAGGNGVSEETKAKLSKAFKGRKNPWTSVLLKQMHKDGRVRAPINLKGAEHKKAAHYVVGEPTGVIRRIHGLKSYCRENGLTFKAMYDTLNGVQRHHKGFALFAKIDFQPERLAA